MTDGVRDLATLLASMEPRLAPEAFVFTTGLAEPPCPAVVTVREAEGLTAVLTRADADREGLAYEYVAARVTLTVHSALEAVGLTAAVAAALADAGISCNVVAGFFHDHLFVPWDQRDRAVDVLREVATRARADAQAGGGGGVGAPRSPSPR